MGGHLLINFSLICNKRTGAKRHWIFADPSLTDQGTWALIGREGRLTGNQRPEDRQPLFHSRKRLH